MGSIVGIALKGFGKALRKDKSTPIRSVKPKAGLEETKVYKEKIKAKQTKPPMARMEYIIEAEDAEGLKRIKKKRTSYWRKEKIILMKKYLRLFAALEAIFGKGYVSRLMENNLM
jgi:hypothetical protein